MSNYATKIHNILHPPATKDKPQLSPTGKAGRNLPAAIGVGVVLGVLVALMLLYLNEAFVFFVIVMINLGIYELAAAVKNKNIEIALLPMWIGSTSMILCAYLLSTQAMLVSYFCTLIVIVLWIFVEQKSKPALSNISVSILGLTWISLLGSFLIILLTRPMGNYIVAIFILIVIASDTGGYIVGVLFGKHPMSKKISPKKSWEGFIGSLSFAALVCVLTMPYLGYSYIDSVIVAIVTAIVAIIGDLCESLIKRDLGLKDMGNLLPGHGGVLDRTDSILIAAIPYTALLHFLG